MNVQKLKDNYPKLIEYMEKGGYSKNYITRINSMISNIITNAVLLNWISYKDIYYYYAKTNNSYAFLKDKRNILGIIEQFDIYNNYPNRLRKPKFIPSDSYHLLNGEYKDIIDNYRESVTEGNKKTTTILSEAHNASVFLLHLQNKGVHSFEATTEKDVLSFFISDDEKTVKSCSYKKNIVAVIKYSATNYPSANKILPYFPKLKDVRKNIQYLTNEEVKKIKDVLHEDDNDLTLRDKAIGCLLVYTGLRSCDIINMKLDSIDWDHNLITLTQQKTGIEIEIPLRPIVANAIGDYITIERPDIECTYSFITCALPYRRLYSRGSLNHTIDKIMDIAHVRLEKGDRRGTHIFRHYVASRLIRNGVSKAVVATTLGHSDPNSTDTYLSADFTNLKKCALSIKQFPIAKEVVDDERL